MADASQNPIPTHPPASTATGSTVLPSLLPVIPQAPVQLQVQLENPAEEENESSQEEESDARSEDTFGRGIPKKVRRSGKPDGFFPHPLDGTDSWGDTLTFREQYIRAFSATVRNKPNWTEKVLDRALFAKWLREAQKQNLRSDSNIVLTWDAKDVAFAYKELTESYKPYVEELRGKGLSLEPDIDGVWRSDNLIDESLRKELIDAVGTLENVSEEQKDWHPGSKKQVLDLVHPSLWPIIYGRSISLLDGEPAKKPEEMKKDKRGFSEQFCWLPSEFEISADGKETKIASYINNLASETQKELFYPILEKIFTQFVPLFNHVLGDLDIDKHNLKRVYAYAGSKYWDEDMIKIKKEDHELKWDELLGQFEKEETLNVEFYQKKEKKAKPAPEDGINQYFEESYDEYPDVEQGDTNYYEVRDSMGSFSDWDWTPPKITDENKLEGKTAKVIVKLANILLTPENPTYDGGSWHVEAMLNERIISTGIYYYDQENITDSELAFRRTVGDVPHVMSLQQYSDWPIVFNMPSWDAATVQVIGRIKTKDKRAIAFPNIFQHQVQPFKLVNNTKPGYRKILVFFLCDPSEGHNIPTTKTVVEQQPEFRARTENVLREGPLGKLPEEVFEMVVEKLPPVVTRAEAEKYRDELMKERSIYNKTTTMVQGVSYSLCEH
ncbi:hypothetical protein ABW20_dc0104574 [Dactylellina cionopaga]|nr:hypothetical protein ABW20_dc0104574 [Dactylellina cionopaga]